MEIISMFKNFKCLKELNLIDNNFNKNFYNINVVPNEIFNNLNDYFSNKNVKNLNQKQIINYRNLIIFNINNLAYLDMIGINEEEKNNALNNNNNLNNLNNLELNDIIQSKNFYLEKLKNLKNELITIEKKIYLKK
jgi:hypothetical protein